MIRSSTLAVLALLCTSALARAASFSCAKAVAPDERAICADPALSNLDSRLVGLLDVDESTVAMGQRGDMRDTQTAWLKTRAACGADRACLRARYQSRLKNVESHLIQRLCGKDGPPC